MNKGMDYGKKYNNLKKRYDRDRERWNNARNTITKHYEAGIQELKTKLDNRDKGWQISIHDQTLTINSYEQAKGTVKELIDLGIWFFEISKK